jgi:hypothetical protein
MDNIRFGCQNTKLDRPLFTKWVNENPNVVIANNNNKFGKNVYASYKVYNQRVYTSYDKNNTPFMEVIYMERGSKSNFFIQNSIRKWHTTKSSIKDIDQWEFIDCIERLGKILFLSKEFMYNLNVYKLEIGRTFVLPVTGKRILSNIFEHPNFKKRINYVDQGSVYLNADSIGIIIYDKWKELLDTNYISKKTYNIIATKRSVIRIELKINKISAVEYAKNNFRTVQDIFYNWDLLTNYWKSEILKIKFIDFLNEKEAELLLTKDKGVFQKYLTLKGIEKIGIDNVLLLLDLFIVGEPQRKYKVKKTIFNLINNMMVHKNSTTQNLVKKLVENTK